MILTCSSTNDTTGVFSTRLGQLVVTGVGVHIKTRH